MKRFNYLLGQTELFQHFIDLKVGTVSAGLIQASKRTRVCKGSRRAAFRFQCQGKEEGY